MVILYMTPHTGSTCRLVITQIAYITKQLSITKDGLNLNTVHIALRNGLNWIDVFLRIIQVKNENWFRMHFCSNCQLEKPPSPQASLACAHAFIQSAVYRILIVFFLFYSVCCIKVKNVVYCIYCSVSCIMCINLYVSCINQSVSCINQSVSCINPSLSCINQYVSCILVCVLCQIQS